MVYEDGPVLQTFKLLRLKSIGGIPAVERGGKAIGNMSIRDVQFLLTTPEIIYKDCRSITTKDFLLLQRTTQRSTMREQHLQ